MKLLSTLAACVASFDLSTMMMMQQMQQPAAGGAANGGMFANPLLMYQLLSKGELGSSLDEMLPLLMMGGGGNINALLPFLMKGDKEEKKDEKVVFKAEKDYQAVWESIVDIADKMKCVQNVFDIFECTQANNLSISDLTDKFEDFKAEDEKAACAKAEAAHKAIFPEENKGSKFFDDDMMMLMMMSGGFNNGAMSPLLLGMN